MLKLSQFQNVDYLKKSLADYGVSEDFLYAACRNAMLLRICFSSMI